MASMMGKAQDVVIILLLVAILGPIGLEQHAGVDTANWSTNVQTVWNNLPVLAIFGILLGFLGYAKLKR